MMTVLLTCLAVASAASAQGDARESRTVQTAQGPVRGYKSDGIFEFYGIPYATTPTGPNRFKAPLPGPVWMQPFEATNNKIVCPQIEVPMFGLSSFSMQENCLIANVYMPDTEDTNLPVLVYVHGGGYQAGWGDLVRPKSLVRSNKIVAVTFNYRLGAHGFLCLGTEGAPGNAGMKDQVALLRWVNKNIVNFGGNPDDVTIAGGSAGSSAADLLMLSKMTDGLYNKVIPESGASVGVWSVQHDPLQIAMYFAKNNNVTKVDSIEALEDFFTTAPYDVLISDLFLDRTDLSFLFVPCVEKNIGVETFLEEAPVNILKQGNFRKVPVLYGFANMEGIIKLHKFDDWKDLMNSRFQDFLPIDLKFTTEEERERIAHDIKEFYFGSNPVGEENIQAYVDYFSDVMFTYPHLRSAKLQVAAGSDSIFLYEYSFHSMPPEELGLPKYIKNIRGANHGAQSLVVHDLSLDFMKDDESELFLKLREIMREMWLNFITTGNPVPEGSKLTAWPPIGANTSFYMDFGEEVTLKDNLLDKRFRFWDAIYEEYYRTPVAPERASTRVEL